MSNILDDLRLQFGSFAAILRPQTMTADRIILLPPDKAGTMMLVEDLASPGAIGGTAPNTIVGTLIDTNGAAATTRQIRWLSAGLTRWSAYANNVAESGSNAGSNFIFSRYTDSGSYLGDGFTIDRATGAFTIPGQLTIGGSLSAASLATTGSLTTTGTITAGDRIATTEVTCALYRNNVGAGTNIAALSTEFRTGRGTGTGALGDLVFTTADLAASGASLQAITTKMIVKGRGSVLIGTTTDNGTDRLQVAGSASIAGNFNATGTANTIGANTNSFTFLGLNGGATANKQLQFQTAGVNRWNLYANGAGGETGGNAGAAIYLSYYNDAGAYAGDIFAANRNGGFFIYAPTTISAIAKVTNSAAATSTTSGALQVVGGMGIGGDTWIGGLVNGAIKFLRSITTGVNAVVRADDGTSPNINLVLQPKGSGAIVGGAPPDGTVTGGNARGTNAIDLQTTRVAATQIADGIAATISGGISNQASGNYSAVAGGNGNSANGSSSAVLSGGNNIASGIYSVGMGFSVASDKYGQFAQASGTIAARGDAQTSVLVARATTANATATDLFLDGSGVSQRLTLTANNSSWTYFITVNAHSKTDRTQQAAFSRRGKIYKLTTNASTALLGGEIADNLVGALPWTVAISADVTNGALKITVTGDATNTIQWVARVELVETFG